MIQWQRPLTLSTVVDTKHTSMPRITQDKRKRRWKCRGKGDQRAEYVELWALVDLLTARGLFGEDKHFHRSHTDTTKAEKKGEARSK